MELSEILEDIQPAPDEAVEVDISPFLAGGRPVVLSWKNPGVAEVYRIGQDAAALKKRNLLWNDALATDVATMAACHAAPQSRTTPPAEFYESIANSKNDRLWHYLVLRMRQGFPHLFAVGEDLKKTLCGPFTSAPDTSEGATP
jgi:hypothetical protein